MKNKKFLRLPVLALVFAICFCALASCASDTEEATEGEFVKWEMLDDEDTMLTDGEKIYYSTYIDHGIPTSATIWEDRYEYCNKVQTNIKGYELASVYAKAPDSEFVWIVNSDGDRLIIYATEEGRAELEMFGYDNVSRFVMKDPTSVQTYQTQIDEDLARSMAESAENGTPIEMDVADLENRTRYEIRAYDQYDFYSFTFGTVYLINESWYFLDYRNLGNDKFDADGNLSYRDGAVSLVRLSDPIGRKIEAAENELEYKYNEVLWEKAELENEGDSLIIGIISIILMLVTFCIFGFAAPLLFIAAGLILPHIKKFGRPKYWYVVSALGALWILIATILLIIFLIVLII